MASYVGRTVISVNAVVIAECKSANERTTTGRKVLRGFSPLGGPIGTTDGTPEYSIDLEVYIPKVGDLVDWVGLEGATLTISPRDGIGKTIIFGGCFTTEVGASYNETDEATRKVTFGALTRVELSL